MIVAIEGADGSGKSTQAKLFAERMGWALQRFPDRTTPVGKLIDEHLKSRLRLGRVTRDFAAADPLDDALMFQALMIANRMEKGDVLWNAKRLGFGLVCDRYYQSGIVYGSADGLDRSHLKQMHRLIPRADFNVLIQVPAETCAQRIRERNHGQERYEDPTFIERIVRGYDELWHEEMKTSLSWVVVDGTRPIETVVDEIVDEYECWLTEEP